MSALVRFATANPLVIAEVAKEVTTLGSNIVQYRTLTAQIDADNAQHEREHLARMDESKRHHRKQSQAIKSLSKGHSKHLQSAKDSTNAFEFQMQQAEQTIYNLQMQVCSGVHNAETLAFLKEEIVEERAKLAKLQEQYMQLHQHKMEGFNRLADSLDTVIRSEYVHQQACSVNEYDGEFRDISF